MCTSALCIVEKWQKGWWHFNMVSSQTFTCKMALKLPLYCTYHPFECSEFLLFPCHLFDAKTFEEPCIVVSLCKIVYQHPVPSELVDFFLPPSPHSLRYSLTVFNINLREAIAVF